MIQIQRPPSERSQHSRGERSIGTLLKEFADQTRTLLLQEVALAKAEIGQNIRRMRRHAISLAVGSLIAHAGVVALIGATCVGLADLMIEAGGVRAATAIWLAMLLAGAALAIAGGALVYKAIAAINRENLVPRQTIDTLRENTEWFKDHIKTSEGRANDSDAAIR